MANGRERRNADWSQPRHRYTAPFLNISKEAYASVKSMHLNRKGSWGAFLFVDVLDNQAVNEIFGVGDGITDTFQLSKWSIVDGVAYQRNVYAIWEPYQSPDGIYTEAGPTTMEVTANGTPTVAYSVDRDTGIVVFDVAPANGVVMRWTSNFAIWVRLTQDWLPWSLDNPNATNGTVDLIEVPAPELGDSDS
jgi:uncharacterized protein (TIGR02217 family)